MNSVFRQLVHLSKSKFQYGKLLNSQARLLSLSTEGLPPDEANRHLRIQLAAAHRGLSDFGLSDRVFNHLSVISPAANGNGNVMLITPFPIAFGEVTPSCLLAINKEGDVVEGDGALHQINGSFHRGFYLGDPSKKCMMHTHSPYVCSLACLEDPTYKMINQTSVMIYKQIGYDMEYGGFVDELDEGKRLGKLMVNGNFTCLLLMHHGAVTAAASVAEAFSLMVAMELSAMYQVNAMRTGAKMVEIKKETVEKAHKTYLMLKETPLVEAHLSSIITKLGKSDPEFKI